MSSHIYLLSFLQYRLFQSSYTETTGK